MSIESVEDRYAEQRKSRQSRPASQIKVTIPVKTPVLDEPLKLHQVSATNDEAPRQQADLVRKGKGVTEMHDQEEMDA